MHGLGMVLGCTHINNNISTKDNTKQINEQIYDTQIDIYDKQQTNKLIKQVDINQCSRVSWSLG